MITSITHASIWCLDQQAAKAFYTEKLGFELRSEAQISPDAAWIAVGPPQQPDVHLVLCAIAPPMVPAEHAGALRELVAAGVLGGAVLEVEDCRATYEELRARGVAFAQEPAERPYGVEAVLRDDSGNWFSMTQRGPGAET